jgi:putative spermidine/putrescine transport system ATP-binding protein
VTLQDSHKPNCNGSERGKRGLSETLRLDNVEKYFGGVRALAEVQLSVPSGQFLTILGPSGSGKTTLLRLLAGFDVPSRGQIFLNREDVSSLPPARRSIGMVFQNYALFPHMTVSENIGYGLKMRQWARKDIDARVAEMLDLVQLKGMGNRKPKELSGGQQQRVALVRALAPRPALLLMDEPLGALDRALRIDMAEEIRRIHRELETTTIYVTHDREEALTLSDRIIIMRNGKIMADGTPEELYRKPASAFVASFFGGHNILNVDDVEIVGRSSPAAGEDARWSALARKAEPRANFDKWRIATPVRKFTLNEPGEGSYLRVRASVIETLFYGDYVRMTCRSDTCGSIVTAWLDAEGIPELNPSLPVSLFSRQQDSVVVVVD